MGSFDTPPSLELRWVRSFRLFLVLQSLDCLPETRRRLIVLSPLPGVESHLSDSLFGVWFGGAFVFFAYAPHAHSLPAAVRQHRARATVDYSWIHSPPPPPRGLRRVTETVLLLW